MKLNIGCGGNPWEGWINIDWINKPGVDIVMDIDKDKWDLSLYENKATEMVMSHILEHLKNPLFVMEQLWHVAAPGCKLLVKVPYGSSDNAWEDQTHVRPYFIGSFQYFSQAPYVVNDYGYRGDWEVRRIVLNVDTNKCDSNDGQAVLEEINTKRNMVKEMTVEMEAIKPRRTIKVGDITKYDIALNFV
jgi:hypothetical protein